MKKVRINFTLCSVILVILFNVLLIYQNSMLKKQMTELMEKLEENLTEKLTDRMSEHAQIVDEKFELTNLRIDEISKTEIEEIAGVKNNISRMKRTYDSILETEKETRVDNSLFDISMREKFIEAKKMFAEGEFISAAKLFRTILEFDNKNIEARLYKMLSVFNVNKMNSSNYVEILSDCKVLKESGCNDQRIDEVESFIQQEQQ